MLNEVKNPLGPRRIPLLITRGLGADQYERGVLTPLGHRWSNDISRGEAPRPQFLTSQNDRGEGSRFENTPQAEAGKAPLVLFMASLPNPNSPEFSFRLVRTFRRSSPA